MKVVLKNQFDQNLKRVKNLVSIYQEGLGNAGQGRKPVSSSDILRSAVVFLHATVEEFLRGILDWRLPNQAENVLERIPLAGAGTERAEKFSLGRLVHHRDKTVQELIQQSVTESLARSNYNSIDEITQALNRAGLQVDPCRGFFPQLDELMKRRHSIVHRADRNEQPGQGNHRAVSIGRYTVNSWITAAEGFFTAVHNQLPD